MAYKKRRLSRGRFIRRTGGRRYGGNRRLKRFVKRVVKRMSEIKYATANNSASVIANQYYVANITPVFPIGTAKYQRIGSKIRYRMLTLNFSYWCSVNNGAAAADDFPSLLRIVVFQPRVALSSPFVDTDIFDSTSNYLSTIKGNACRVLYDKMYPVTPTNDANQIGSNTQLVVKKLHFRINNEVNFRDATVGTATDVKDNYYILVYSIYSGSATVAFTIQGGWYSRISYYDI